MPLKVVLDTNVVISGFLWSGIPYRILLMAENGAFEAFSSTPILDELENSFGYDKFLLQLSSANLNPAQARTKYEAFVTIVEPVELPGIIVKADPSDDKIVKTAISAHAEYIITGNNHLLKLKHSFDFRIITPAVFINVLTSAV